MGRPKLPKRTKGQTISLRLDDETYKLVKEAQARGEVDSISEVVRQILKKRFGRKKAGKRGTKLWPKSK